MGAHISGTNGYPGATCFKKSEPSFFVKGHGGCSTPWAKFPAPTKKTTSVSASACRNMCGSWCGAYDYCSGSNCDGNCLLFSSPAHISGTNGYPGATCFKKSEPSFFVKGHGGCSTPWAKFPAPTKRTSGVSASACRDMCGSWCGAYDYCSGSNCDGNCLLFSSPAHISGTNGYPGATCFKKSEPSFFVKGHGGCST